MYLIDIQGSVTHTWPMPYPPGQYGYLTDKGTLFYNGRTPGEGFLAEQNYKGGVALEADWNGKVLWEVQQPDHHHDGRLLPNGNVLLLCQTEIPADIAKRVRGGIPGTEDNGNMYADYMVEMTTGGQTVWEWRVWEHLDPGTDGHTSPGDSRAVWTLGNAVRELPDGNILLSMRNISSVVRINRQTGEIDWKLGAPPLAGQHAPTPLPNGNYLILDNGPFRVDQGNSPFPFSRVVEVDPATNKIIWKYQDPFAESFFSGGRGNAQRLPNGNTLINEAASGRFFEVTPDGDVVWEYVNPYFGPATAPPKAQNNNAFRVYRYSADEIAAAQRTT